MLLRHLTSIHFPLEVAFYHLYHTNIYHLYHTNIYHLYHTNIYHLYHTNIYLFRVLYIFFLDDK